MTKVVKLNLLRDKNHLIGKLRNKKLLVYEEVQGSKIYVKWTGEKFIIVPKSINNDPLNFVDLATQKYYNGAYVYLHTLPDYVTNLLNTSWWFCFEYFPDNQPAHIEYSKLPKNNLILSCIVKGARYTYDIDELVEYSNLLDVDMLPILFSGYLSSKQLEVITLFLNTSEEDLRYVFGESNFAHFFYKILNPLEENSFLMKDGEYNRNLEKVIIKLDGDSRYTFEILNPLYRKMVDGNSTDYVKTYSRIILNFLEYCQIQGFNRYKPVNITKDKLYVDLICLMFNDYVKSIRDDLDKWNISIPNFFAEDKFKINQELLSNKTTVAYIQSDAKLEYIFKIILNTFSRRKKKPIGVFTEQNLTVFNNLVESISNYLDTLLKANKEYTMRSTELLNFTDYFNIPYNTDSSGKIYLDNDKIRQEEEIALDRKADKDKKGSGMPSMKKK